MKPETPMSHPSPEQPSIQHGSIVEHEPTIYSPEIDNKNGAERYEQIAETKAVSTDVSLTTMLPAPVITNEPVAQDTTVRDTILIVNDDLIEKEWVNKAKQIVSETRDNPYQREVDVNKLQSDYLKKRYGKELGVAE